MITINHINPTHYLNNSNIETSNSNQKVNENNFKNKLGKYVEISNNKYVINPSIYLNKDITAQDIQILNKTLDSSNKIIEQEHIKNISKTTGNVVNTNNKSNEFANFSEIVNGYNGCRVWWWGMTVSLNSVNTQAVINGGSGAAGALIGGLFGAAIADVPGAIGGGVIGAIVGGALSAYGLNSTEAVYGSITQINFSPNPHVQAVSAE